MNPSQGMAAEKPARRIASTVNFAGVLKRPATADLDEVRGVLLSLKGMRGELHVKREHALNAGHLALAAFYESTVAQFDVAISPWEKRRGELEHPPQVGDDERTFAIAALSDLHARAISYGSQASTRNYPDTVCIMGQEAKCLGDLLSLFLPDKCNAQRSTLNAQHSTPGGSHEEKRA